MDGALQYLLTEHGSRSRTKRICSHTTHRDVFESMDYWTKVSLLKELLCVRSPSPKLPADINKIIDDVLHNQLTHRITTSAAIIGPRYYVKNLAAKSRTSLTIWKGDITTLSNVTTIVNAANSQLLGCFQPRHHCIDNAIHAAAGPALREACFDLMTKQDHPEDEGQAKVTPGFNLEAQYVIHTVGPQVRRGQPPSSTDVATLSRCYHSCLDAAESLPAMPDGEKVLAFSCISTGLYGFLPDRASSIAVSTVLEWLRMHPETTLTNIIFNVFTDTDLKLYQNLFKLLCQRNQINPIKADDTPRLSSLPRSMIPKISDQQRLIQTASSWLSRATTLIVTAGAGLSAASGLDYTSPAVFSTHLAGFQKYGFHCLYDVFGFDSWPSEQVRWSYFISHLNMVCNWPQTSLYASLRKLAERNFGPDRHFIRTTNADGFFEKNGFKVDSISTPQGQYAFFQCEDKCRADAVFPSKPYIAHAMEHIDQITQHLPQSYHVPTCEYCGARLVICVRGGDYFNDGPFRIQEAKWRQFLQGCSGGSTVILEIGVGMNTPSVLRWCNEDIVEKKGGDIKLIRLGLGPAGCVSPELEKKGLAVGLTGDLDRLFSLVGITDERHMQIKP